VYSRGRELVDLSILPYSSLHTQGELRRYIYFLFGLQAIKAAVVIFMMSTKSEVAVYT
jgi:hypothetical protein